jgi:co-chaperonin GroES (HSP10)
MDFELRMCGSRVLVRTEDQQEHTNPTGVIVVESYAPEVIGTVISCGDVQDVKPGDVVLFAPQSGTVMDVCGSRYLVLHEDEILAKWDEEQEPE